MWSRNRPPCIRGQPPGERRLIDPSCRRATDQAQALSQRRAEPPAQHPMGKRDLAGPQAGREGRGSPAQERARGSQASLLPERAQESLEGLETWRLGFC